ncbi:MAG: DUF4190 domain-containing protein [Microscillaceae bacterium]|jgi:hypothetical protein|nr:DUF4190 domain-containing protein [Microscillaceae bacterium]
MKSKIILTLALVWLFSWASWAADSPRPYPREAKNFAQNVVSPRYIPAIQRLAWWQKLGLKIAQKKIQKKLAKSGTIPTRKTDGFAIFSFIFGLAAWFVWGIVLGLIAVIFGAISIARIDSQPTTRSGKGWAIAGLMMGSLAILLLMLFFSALIIG